MKPVDQLDLFARLHNTPGFRQWIAAEHDEAYKYLLNAAELPIVHRAQGRLQLLDEIIKHMDKAKDLR